MGFNQFTYWRNDVLISDTKPVKKVPKGGTEKLVYYKILNGEYDESPYWNMSLDCIEQLKNEVLDWKQKNSRACSDAFDDWYCNRRKVYNKKIIKLREEHQRLELKRLVELEHQFNKDFGFDTFPIDLGSFDGNLQDLYQQIKEMI